MRSRRRWRAGVLFALVTAGLAALPAGAAGQGRVEAGPLVADMAADPWRLTFRDRSGSPVLSESPDRGAGATGALGFRTPAGWARATRVVEARAERGAYAATLATTDAGGRRLEVRIAPAADGVVTLQARVAGAMTGDLSAVGIAFDARPGERYLGFGERSNAVDQRGGTVENRVVDGPYQPEERPFIAGIVPAAGYSDRDDATYFPMPWLLSTAGYGVLADNDEVSVHRLGTDAPGAWSVEVQSTELRLRVFAGPEPADVLRRLTEHTGRQPPPAAPWFFGPWFQPRGGVDQQLAEARALREADAPASVAQTYTHYLPCGAQQGQQERERRRTRELHAAGYAVTTYFNPMVCTNYAPVYDRAAREGLLTRDATGRPATYRYGASADADDQFLVGQIDFSIPAGRAFFGELLGEAVADGYDGWMEDFGEYTPPDSRSGDGSTGATMHNRYPVLYHRASAEYALGRRPGVAGFIRSGWTGVHPHAQLVWGGDPSTDWGFDGLESALRQGLTMGLSGISRWGSDIGGFFALGRRRLTPELLVRWIELGAVSGVMRTQANGVALPPQADRPQILDPAILPVWRRYAKLRTQLYPYVVAADAAYRRTGLPVMRHMALAHPGDGTARERDDQFLFGPDLLAAPVLRPGQRERRVYLPPGRWIAFGSSIAPSGPHGGLALGRAALLAGEREVVVPAPLESLPLLLRAGSVLPLLPAEVDTLAGRGDGGSGTVSLADRARTLRLLAVPRGRTMARFGEDGRIDSIERLRRWRLKVRGAAGRRIRLEASMRTLERPFRPCRLRVDGKPLRRRAWRYDPSTAVLRVTFRARRDVARLEVFGRRCSA